MALAVMLIGPPRIARDGQPVTFDTRKAMALLAHLALAERPRSRSASCCGRVMIPSTLDGPGAQVRLLESVAAIIGAACEGPQHSEAPQM